MDFKVFTDNAGTYVEYGDHARYSVEGGVLTVVSGSLKIIYGPSGWTRVEAPTPEGTWAASEAQAKARATTQQAQRPVPPGTNG